MSRSQPNDHAPNPAVRWFEWSGEKGILRYYDKTTKDMVDVPLPFSFLFLDEVASVRGWHEASKSGIYSNEVKDTRADAFVVKAFKGGILAEGFYKDIKDRINVQGGRYVANCYIAFKENGNLAIGSLRWKGSALGAWMEFRKDNRHDLYEWAVDVTGYTEGKKGRITYRMPTFALKAVSAITQEQAVALDVKLQGWLTDYFNRRTTDRTEPETDSTSDESHEPVSAAEIFDEPPF